MGKNMGSDIWALGLFCRSMGIRAKCKHHIRLPVYCYLLSTLQRLYNVKSVECILPHEINRERLWKDVESACVEIARIDSKHCDIEKG